MLTTCKIGCYKKQQMKPGTAWWKLLTILMRRGDDFLVLEKGDVAVNTGMDLGGRGATIIPLRLGKTYVTTWICLYFTRSSAEFIHMLLYWVSLLQEAFPFCIRLGHRTSQMCSKLLQWTLTRPHSNQISSVRCFSRTFLKVDGQLNQAESCLEVNGQGLSRISIALEVDKG